MLDAKDAVLKGNIVELPVEGNPTLLNRIPDGLTPLYSGQYVILGKVLEAGPLNIRAKEVSGHDVIGDVVIMSQAKYQKEVNGVSEARPTHLPA